MNRKELLAKLTTISPALSHTDLVPVMTHFWFTGNEIMAYNDQIAISVPFKSDVTGAVPGETLLALLKNSKAVSLEMLPLDGGNLQIKAASSRFKLALLPDDSFVFDMPETKDEPLPIKDKKQFLDCIDTCMRSVGADTAVADQLGITLIPEGDKLGAYATNNQTLSYARINLNGKAGLKKRVILPGQFCEQLLRLGRGAKQIHLEINDKYALFVGGGTTMFGRLIQSDRPINFVSIVENNFSEADYKKLVPIPSKMRLILERAMVITDSSTDQGRTSISVKGGVMKFASKTPRGEVHDELEVGRNQPDASIRVRPKFLKDGYGFFDKMLITEPCVVMTRDHMLYLVAAYSSAD